MGSKEGCRALFSIYDQNIYLHGGRGIKAITKLEIYHPLKNQFVEVNNYCPTGIYNHSLV